MAHILLEFDFLPKFQVVVDSSAVYFRSTDNIARYKARMGKKPIAKKTRVIKHNAYATKRGCRQEIRLRPESTNEKGDVKQEDSIRENPSADIFLASRGPNKKL